MTWYWMVNRRRRNFDGRTDRQKGLKIIFCGRIKANAQQTVGQVWRVATFKERYVSTETQWQISQILLEMTWRVVFVYSASIATTTTYRRLTIQKDVIFVKTTLQWRGKRPELKVKIFRVSNDLNMIKRSYLEKSLHPRLPEESGSDRKSARKRRDVG